MCWRRGIPVNCSGYNISHGSALCLTLLFPCIPTQCVGPRSMGPEFLTWDQALQANGHTDVHILKIDIEGGTGGVADC